MTEEDIKNLSKKELQDIIFKVQKLLSDKQKKEFQKIVKEAGIQPGNKKSQAALVRMLDDFVNEKMIQIQNWKDQIDEGELYLDTEEYEDYSSGYWEADWITEYYDNQGIGDKIMSMIRFAEDCVDDRRYQEANEIYEWLWQMSVSTDSEYEDYVDLEMLEENNLIHTDMKHLALLTLYADYQVLPAKERARDIYLYFSSSAFTKLHLEEMFHVGREELEETEQFWEDWFTLGILDYIDMFEGTMNAGLKTFIIDTYKAQVEKLKELQDPKTGLWHTVLTAPDSYVETSGTAAITAGILKGIRCGILDDSYLPCAVKAIRGILDRIDSDGTVLEVSGGTGMGMDAEHYKNILIAPMAYGQSLTILALAEALNV